MIVKILLLLLILGGIFACANIRFPQKNSTKKSDIEGFLRPGKTMEETFKKIGYPERRIKVFQNGTLSEERTLHREVLLLVDSNENSRPQPHEITLIFNVQQELLQFYWGDTLFEPSPN